MKPLNGPKGGVEMDDELLSAFVDDALHEQERRQVIQRLCRDSVWRGRYERYLLIGAALRHERPLWRPDLLSAAVAWDLAAQSRQQAPRLGVQPAGSRGHAPHARRMPGRSSQEVMGTQHTGRHPTRGMVVAAVLLAMMAGVGYFRVFEGIDGSPGEALPASAVAEADRGGHGSSRPVSQALSRGMMPGQDGEPASMQVVPVSDSDYLLLADEGSLLAWHTLLDPNAMLTSYADPLGSIEPSVNALGHGEDRSEPRSRSEAGGRLAAPRITQVQDSGFPQ